MTLRVHIMHAPEPEVLRLLPPGIAVTTGVEPPGDDFEILVAGRPTPELLAASNKLRALVIPWAGLPAPTAKLLRDYPALSVHNLHHNAAATAEMAVALLLAAAKTLPRGDASLRRGDWSLRFDHSRALQLEGRRALVLGMGAIGRRVARACAGLGMSVRGVSRGGQPVDGIEVAASARLDALLPEADALLVCVPATAETEGMLGASQLALLPRDALLVNVARGAVVDEPALYEALRDGRMFGAGLDVWWRYPGADDDREDFRPSNLPFHELPNVVFSPHRGGHVKDTEQRRMQALADLLQHTIHGNPLPNAVDLSRGY
jgi:phosphoglycerate dehydrogenase-like enzyme